MNFKRFLAAAMASVLVFSLAACSGSKNGGSSAASQGESGAATTQPQEGSTLTAGLSSAPISANIWVQNDINSSIIMNLVVPNLVTMDETGSKYNYLAESATPNEDSTQWTIVLKELYWNDGTPVTANDLAFGAKYGVEHKIGFFDSYYGKVTETEVKDDKTVVFHLSDPDVNFWNGAGYWLPLMRESEWSSVEDPLNHAYSGAGYGPYYIDEWVDGQYVSLKRNEYFKQANDGKGALIDNVLFRVYTDENAAVLALQNGEIDVCANYISPNSKSQLAASENFQLTDIESLGYGQISYSQSNPLLQDVNVRKALAMSIERDAMVAVGMSGAAKAMQTVISPVYQQFTKANIQQPAYDPAGAKAMLEQNGYKDADGDGILESADGKKLEFSITYRSSIQSVDNVMEILRTAAAQAGIKINLEPVDPSTFSAKVTNGRVFDISYNMWGTIDDVDTTLYTCYGIGQMLNYMDYNNEEMDALLLQMKSTPNPEDRVKLLDEWQKLAVENIPISMTYVPVQTYVANTDKFEGFKAVYGNHGYLSSSLATQISAK
ncbi:ABC transporter substrate-binding protein [Oscillospiraceae bacterium MB08-C2-2]|nr:ABC transporter substrate-binding protein [Oscillospiraceae bacterium MB08-C2-2]